MQKEIIIIRYMKILANIKANVYKDNEEQLKKDLIMLRTLLCFIDKPNKKTIAVEKYLTKRLASKR